MLVPISSHADIGFIQLQKKKRQKGKNVLEVPDTSTQVLANTGPFFIQVFWASG